MRQKREKKRFVTQYLSSHVPQVSDVGGHGLSERVEVDVLHAVLLADLLDDGSDSRVVVLEYIYY